jgi:iron complex transport system substrate-binding protein
LKWTKFICEGVEVIMKKSFSVLLAILLVFLLAACGNQQGDQTPQTTKNQPADRDRSTGQENQQKQAFPVTITDAAGHKVTIQKKPKRIISLVPSNTEITYALGAGKRMVADSKFDNYPKPAKELPKIGGQKFNVEKIISLKPDLVLALDSNEHNSKSGLDQLRQAGIKVVVIKSATSFADVYHSIDVIGKATGTTDRAKNIIHKMKSKIAAIKTKADAIPKKDRVKVWVEVSAPPDIYTTGSGTFMDQMLDIINAKNVASDKKGWVKYSSEAAVKKNPDVIVLTYGYYTKNAVKKVLHRDGWQNVSAVKNKRVFSVNSDLVSRPGPRLVKGVEQLAQVIYPDVFKK